jgi:lactoylglutathione lyase
VLGNATSYWPKSSILDLPALLGTFSTENTDMTPLQGILASLVATTSLLAAASTVADAEPPAAKPTLEFRGAHVVVKDVPKTVKFYGRAFGLSLKYMHPTQGYAELASGAVLLAFISEEFIETTNLLGTLKYQKNRREHDAGGSQLVFVSTNIADDYTRALRAGAVMLKSPELKPWGQTVGYLRDINGYMVELCTPQTR